jgi:soluble lytic murein transglycosylase
VQATIAGKLWDHLEERFPLAYKDLFDRYTSGKDIPQSYAMAIARQESAWNPKVRSRWGQRPDADYAGHGDAHGEDV